MLAFACPVCDRLVTFEGSRCLHCGSAFGFDPGSRTMRAVATADRDGLLRCANAELAACNWLVDRPATLCASCALTRTRPNDADSDGLRGFATAEGAKRRLLFELSDLGLPIVGAQERTGGLAFDLLTSNATPVTTGHANGLITLDLDETDSVQRERMRVHMGEPYRTVLGHFRHEIGHYYQPIVIASESADEERCRGLFGDEREDYERALERYYENGAPAGWEQRYVSAYATMHPWEDWAESFAHYLHLRDTLQTAAAYGVRVEGPAIETTDRAPLDADPSGATADIQRMLRSWIPMTYALNAVNRSMGEPDLYPFILTPEIEAKLAFIDEVVRKRAR
jgi:hypothetical protein